MPVVHLVGETPDLAIQVARAIKGQSACLKPVLATVFLDVPGNTSTRGISVHKTGNYHDIPWNKMQSMRNVIMHKYFRIDEEILWQTIQEDLPPVIPMLEPLLKK